MIYSPFDTQPLYIYNTLIFRTNTSTIYYNPNILKLFQYHINADDVITGAHFLCTIPIAYL